MTAECREAGRGRRRLLPRHRCSLLPAPVSRRAPTEHHICSHSGLHDARLPARPTAPPPPPPVRPRRSDRLTPHIQRSMLQRTSLCMQVDETANQLIEDCTLEEVSSGASTGAVEDIELPQCKIKRNYNCTKCAFYTQNPRSSLIHARIVHNEKLKIFECSYCLYASKHHQKLLRHEKMIHTNPNKNLSNKPSVEAILIPPDQSEEQFHDQEDMFEDFEEDIAEIEVDDDDDALEINVESELEGVSSQPDQNEQGQSKKNRKDNYFSCEKCNYVTHIKCRYTKHVKYHSMPMIKCTLCDFRTPYKWNLDRHMKNHGGPGNFKCSMCNFTADIKQSLTVHEMNHHAAAVGISSSVRRRNRVGASDSAGIGLIVREVEGSGEPEPEPEPEPTTAADMGAPDADIELVSCTSESNDGLASSKMDESSNDASCDRSVTDQDDCKKNNRKPARPIPQLIPINTSTPSQNKSASNEEPPAKKLKEDTNENQYLFQNLPADISLIPVVQNTVSNKEPNARKKNNSFFDKLKERLLTETGEKGTLTCKDCGFESKCLSEHSVHEKNCNAQGNKVQASSNVSNLGSSRCQYCRHRCKSSADLYQHLQTCSKKNDDETKMKSEQPNSDEKMAPDNEEGEPHPMENVVFVWNNLKQEEIKFTTPLGININDDATLPKPIDIQVFDPENGDENDGMILSPTQAVGKKVFKCPQCPFWASTASRFHVHIVGHLNKKPFECSLCKYKSNWRWDITKHIKLKSVRDPEHNGAKVLMTDETGRRNYSKYNKFLAVSIANEGGENELVYVDPDAAATDSVDMEESPDGQPLNLQTHNNPDRADNKPKKTMWKCKRCNYKDQSKEALLEHVKEHSKMPEDPNDPKKLENKDPNDLAYRCGHCNQLSNWKHVIQRHCRLKHEGVIKVVAVDRPKMDPNQIYLSDIQGEYCTKCPFKSSDKNDLATHSQQHSPSPLSIFKCYFCPFFVKNEEELLKHLQLHGINDPQEYVSKSMSSKSPVSEPAAPTKRHKCTECPYETNSKSQYMYHEQFHRLPADTPYKCQECNYSVSKRHLLHQHMRVHGIIPKKGDAEFENEASTSTSPDSEIKDEQFEGLEDIPYVWVSAKNEFHKMYKCRYCSYVVSQKNKIPIHEKVHLLSFDDSEAAPVYKCLECKFTCYNAAKLSEHSKGHGEMYGRIYCYVKPDVSDEEQIQKLRKIIEEEKMAIMDGLKKDETPTKDVETDRLLYFCSKCPARFFSDTDINTHFRFHKASFPNKCNICEFSVPLENQLKAHYIVHTYDYQSKTKLLKAVHETHPDHQEPKLDQLATAVMSKIPWELSETANNSDNLKIKPKSRRPVGTKTIPRFLCGECPAKFFKGSARNYHRSLHGSDGEHKCKSCSYAVKNIGNLAKHELIHMAEGKTTTVDYESADDGANIDFKNIPLSGTDLFHRKTEAQKRGLNDKTKLVKPNDHFPPMLQADPQFGYLMHGSPEFIYPTYLKNGRQKEKRYKCHKCPSAFEKREQYKIHLSLHGSKQRYKCELCDYSVKYYANYVQHMRKHQMNDEAQAERTKDSGGFPKTDIQDYSQEDGQPDIKLAIKTMPKSAPRSDFQQFSVCDQQILRLLQRRRSINGANETSNPESAPTKDRKQHLCTLCPYSNQRLNALRNHYRRHEKEHIINLGHNKCPHCNLAAVQSNTLGDHMKTHFNYSKTMTPNCFTANESVTFTITSVEENSQENGNITTDIKILPVPKNNNHTGDKIFVKVSTGEIVQH